MTPGKLFKVFLAFVVVITLLLCVLPKLADTLESAGVR